MAFWKASIAYSKQLNERPEAIAHIRISLLWFISLLANWIFRSNNKERVSVQRHVSLATEPVPLSDFHRFSGNYYFNICLISLFIAESQMLEYIHTHCLFLCYIRV